jgi:hypothetical protein
MRVVLIMWTLQAPINPHHYSDPNVMNTLFISIEILANKITKPITAQQ